MTAVFNRRWRCRDLKIIEGLCDDDDGDNVFLELRESLELSSDGDNGEELGAGVETNIYVTEAGFV